MISDLAMLERLVSPADKDVVDVGCGGGALVRALTDLGARVTGVEISESQLATAIEQDDGGGARYLVGRAEWLPLNDETVDVVVFMRSFHHVPREDLDAALVEARRVIRPGGAVYVAEPLAEGNFFELHAPGRRRDRGSRGGPGRARPGLERRPAARRPHSTTTRR